MNRADSPKPPVAPKPKTASPLTPVTAAKFPSSPRPDSLHSPNSMSRGPKPPIAPKPRLDTPNEWRASVYMINSLNKCSNGKLLCVDRGLYEEQQSNLECSEAEADEDYIVVPRAPPTEDEPRDGDSVENAVMVPSDPTEEEEPQEEGEEEGTGAAEEVAVPAEVALSGEADEGVAPIPENVGADDCAQDPGTEEQKLTSEEEEKLVEEHNMYNLEDRGPWDAEAVFPSDIILTQVDLEGPEAPGKESGPPRTPREEEGDGEEGCANAEPGAPDEYADSDRPTEGGAEDANEEPLENEGLATAIQEMEIVTDSPEISEMECEDAIGSGNQDDQDEPPDQSEKTDQEGMAAVTQEAREDAPEGEDSMQDEPAEESCQIIPFENECMDDFVTSLSGSPYEFFATESTSFCSESYSSFSESAKGLETEQEAKSGECVGQDAVAENLCGQCGSLQDDMGEGLSVPDMVVLPEAEDATDDALTNPYEMGVDLVCGTDPGGEKPETQAASDVLSGYDSKEEVNSDAEGGLVPVDRKNIVSRARPHSGKVPGYVPETVPEETGPEAISSSAISIGGATEEARKMVLSLEGKPLEASRALPAKPRAFTLYPRSFSVEGREIPVSVYREPETSGLEDHRIKRKDDNLSLPCVIGSSGSFSQRNHLPSSGTSTPSSVVDIPPPFDLACITKKPITKSSPSLLIESEPPDKHSKKKKSSFKRFLALTFKKKTENKVHVDVNVSSSRSSSESSYHGPSRLLEIDRRSLSNSPQLKVRTGKLRASDSPSSLIFYRDGKRKGVPFSRTVSRVESFEDRSRPPFLPLPLTKPRSISFPNADTSDYENIPAMNSDYENIQIPPRRPARAGTFTKLFEDQSRALSTANENDGYVDMSSFNTFESKQQSADQEAESAYTEPYKVCPISTAAPKEDLTSDEEQGSSEEEDSAPKDPSLTHKVEGQSRAHVIAQELLSSEKAYVEMLQHLHLVS